MWFFYLLSPFRWLYGRLPLKAERSRKINQELVMMQRIYETLIHTHTHIYIDVQNTHIHTQCKICWDLLKPPPQNTKRTNERKKDNNKKRINIKRIYDQNKIININATKWEKNPTEKYLFMLRDLKRVRCHKKKTASGRQARARANFCIFSLICVVDGF